MIKLSSEEIIKATGGILICGAMEQKVKGISIDSRTIKPGELFVAIKGEHHDGHNYIDDVLNKGACGIIRKGLEKRGLSPENKIIAGYSSRSRCVDKQNKGDCPQIVIEVSNPLQALHDISHHLLIKVNPKVIAITGSTGKTTVKDMLKSVLSKKFNVLASSGNFNNEFGLPLTLAELAGDTQIVILEMGMRGKGQIADLCRIASPDYALITNIGHSHLELLKSKENIIESKGEIIKGLKPGGTLFLNADDSSYDQLKAIAQQSKTEVISYGEDAQVSYNDVEYDNLARAAFTLKTQDSRLKTVVQLPIPGRHFVSNATAVAAIALKLGLSKDDISEGLEAIELTAGRMQITQVNGWLVINDSYNASPNSTKEAIKALNMIKANRKVAILGSMLELGDCAEEAHNEIGREVAKSGLAMLITVGDLGKSIAKSAIEAGMGAQRVKSYNNSLELKKDIISYLMPDDAILIKASRAIELDIIANYLQNKR